MLMKFDGKEYGLGSDVAALPDDPKGHGPRAATPEETASLIELLTAAGYAPVRSDRVHRVYVIEDGGRRVMTFCGRPLDVFDYGRPEEQAPAENPIDEPNPADEAPVELVPLEDAPTDPVGVPALVEPEIPAESPGEPKIPVPVEEPAPEKPEGA
jgi:hypothetical protein